jgi:lysine-specific histone demethylase 1B
MKRRNFLKNSLFATAGGLFLPSALLQSCRKNTLFEEVSYDGNVLIIGAGAAGLYAGYVLQSKGIDFQILEASGRYGGRLEKLTGFADFPIDVGAEWLHGKNNILGDLVAKSNTEITLDKSAEYYWFNNQVVSKLPDDITAVFTREDTVPDISFADFAVQEGFGDNYKNIVEGIAGDSGAAASRISAYWKIKEEEKWNSGDDDFKFRETYFDFFDAQVVSHIKDKIKLNTVISKIDYSQEKIAVTDSTNNTYMTDKVIITVPVTILKGNDIAFAPVLPQEKISAFAKIGMDAGMKVYLKFSKKFYLENIFGGNVCAAYADESVGKTGKDNILLAFIMGKQAEYLTSLGSDAAITSALLQELDILYGGQATSSFLASHVENWTTHPYIRGAYSYSTVGMGNARQIAAQTIDDKLFFAGEAMNTNGHHQTVFGAVETGYHAVINILNSIKK